MVKTIILFSCAIILPWLCGLVFLSLMEKGERSFSPLERLILSYALGTGLLSLYMLGLGILYEPFKAVWFAPFFAVFFLLYLYCENKAYPVFYGACVATDQHKERPPFSWAERIIVAVIAVLIVFKLVFVIANIVYLPTYFDDAFEHWNLRAKIIFYDDGLSMDQESESFLGGTHKKHYPLYIQLFKAYVMIVIGEWKEPAAKLISFLYALFILLIVYANLRGVRSFVLRLIFTYAVSAVPLFLVHSASNFADLTLSFFVTASGIYLCRWFDSANDSFLIVSASMLGLAAFTKNEGLAMYMPCLFLTLFLFVALQGSGRWVPAKKGLAYAAIFLAFYAPWLYVRWKFGLGLDESGSGIRLAFHPEALILFYEKVLFAGGYNLFWFGLFFITIAGRNHLAKPYFRYRFILVYMAFLFCLFPFMFMDKTQYLANEMTGHRVFLVPIPFAIYCCGLLADKLLPLEDGRGKNQGTSENCFLYENERNCIRQGGEAKWPQA